MTRTIKIVPVLNGFVVHAGCQTVVFESREKLLIELKNYLSNPIVTERQFLADALNPDLKEQIQTPMQALQRDLGHDNDRVPIRTEVDPNLAEGLR